MSKLFYLLAGAGLAAVGVIGTVLAVDHFKKQSLDSSEDNDSLEETSEESLESEGVSN
jgi:hypothetical protein